MDKTMICGTGMGESQDERRDERRDRCTSLALASSGVPYVAYQDGANGSKANVMKY